MSKQVIATSAVIAGLMLVTIVAREVLGAPWAVVEGILMGLPAAIPLAALYFPYPQVPGKLKWGMVLAALVFGYYFLEASDPLAHKTALLTVVAVFAAGLYVRTSPLHQRLEVALSLKGWELAEEKKNQEEK